MEDYLHPYKMKKLAAIILFLLLALPVYGATTTIYLNKEGDGTQCDNDGGGTMSNGCTSLANLNALNPTTGNDIVVNIDAGDTFNDATLDLGSWTGTYPSVTIQGDGGKATITGASYQPIKLDDDLGSWTIQTFTLKNLDIDDQTAWDGANGTQVYLELGDATTITIDNVDGDSTSDGSATYGADFLRIIRPGTSASGSIKVEIKNCDVTNIGPEPFGEHPDSTDAYGFEVDAYNAANSVYVLFHNNTADKVEADMLHLRLTGDVSNDTLLYDNTATDCGEETFDIKSSKYGQIYHNTMNHSGTYNFGSGVNHIQIHSDAADVPNTIAHDWDVYENLFKKADDRAAIAIADNADSNYTTYNINVYDNYFEDSPAGVTLLYYVHDIDIYRNVMVFTDASAANNDAIHIESLGTNIKVRSNSIYSDQNLDGVYVVDGYGTANTIVEANAIRITDASSVCLYDETASSKFYPTYNTINCGTNDIYWGGANRSAPYQNNDFESPGFSDSANGDLSLTNSSNAKGNASGSNETTAGLVNTSTWTPSFSITTHARDASPDAGAYEYIGTNINLTGGSQSISIGSGSHTITFGN